MWRLSHLHEFSLHWACMKAFCAVILLTTAWIGPALSQKGANPFAGRWDLTVTMPNGTTYPDWLEVKQDVEGLTARYQPRGGSVRPIQSAQMSGDHLLLTLAPNAGKGPAMTWDLTSTGGQIAGVQKRGDAVVSQIAGTRAPELRRKAPKSWTTPEPLFNGKDLTGWEPDNPANNHWVAENGVLLDQSKGANLRTTRKFEDFKLHVEFNCPEEGNSGVYLRGRYEIQVEYEPVGTEDGLHSMGSIYGLLAPKVNLPRKPGEWESFDVTLVGRRVTISRNGTLIIDNQEIAGITGGAIDSNEGQPGPFYLQGDHTGGMKYRNFTVSLPKR